jgi:hypothetical protein
VAIKYRLGSVVMKSLCVLVPNAHMEIGQQIVPVIRLSSSTEDGPIGATLVDF